jgi:hypothetical protein
LTYGTSPRVGIKSLFSLQLQQKLALLATAFLFPSAGATLVLPWLLVIRILQLVRQHRLHWVRSPLDFSFVAFLVLALIAGFISPLPAVALGSWFLVSLAFVIVLRAALDTLSETPNFVRSLHKAFGLGTLCAAVYGLLVFYVHHLDRAQLLTLGPNALGLGLMVEIFLSVPLL